MYRSLTWVDVETELVSYPREEHHIKEAAHQIDLLERVLAWFDRYLGPESSLCWPFSPDSH